MEILLRDDVPKLGRRGDIVKVATGYARNYLFPRGLAVKVNPENLKQVEEHKRHIALLDRRRLEDLKGVAQKLSSVSVTIQAKANEEGHLFGSVFKHEIAENLRAQGFEVPDDVVAIEQHIKEVGTYKINLEFDDDIKAVVNLVVVPEGADVEAFKAAQKEAAKKSAEKKEQPASTAKPSASPRGEQDEPAEAPAEEKPQQ